MSKLGKFCKGSKYFEGFTMQGFFSMPTEHFEQAFEHYLVTGKNVLDEYAEIQYLLWDAENYFKDDPFQTPVERTKKIKYYEDLISNKKFWNINYFYEKEEMETIKKYLMVCKDEIKYRKSYQYKREQACLYTSDPTIRKKVFKRDGRKCVNCGTSKKLTLDHIIPVSKNGKNKLENMQVLCRSCNSSKGDKCISKLT